ncbi:bifunctional precorrin-2 dehydrogenase/sirohydrochlorin ferrochelatase [Paenibacillus athensensis]|uniref:precorrin-2 dehydrogenase n=1 Tax=Paenibacillus athensensis TaxID=1967502 RepID=A0A4Y8PSC2_9BACL|nr:bifunctional precorrin-2 dehydrogenase/sirohydrochlorin ferrochelatase [Paenibacillus athensensis]MCD1258158.1 bifunctional precorrin-2 dehydrogenase/sirohydrochlorin ferrochelatase [Paenibacillus athensensis]
MGRDYPIHLQIEGCACLVVGGGQVAFRKVSGLLGAGARVSVISPSVGDELAALAARGDVVLYSRPYAAGDVAQGAADGSRWTLVFAATDAPEVNRRVCDEAAAQGVLVSVADQPELGSFIVPSVVRRGKLTLAVSTGGASPSLGRRIAGELAAVYGEEFGAYMEFLAEARALVQRRVDDQAQRQRMFRRMLEWDVPALIRDGAFESWRRELLAALEREPDLRTVDAFVRRD